MPIMSKVSVIIPVYNRPVYVTEAIESVLKQTHQDWELIVVDDGSTDETAAAIAKYGSYLQYLYQPNSGVASARNLGFAAVKGDYVLFLDSDDLLLPCSLELLSRFLDDHRGVGIVYSDAILCDANGVHMGLMSAHRPPIEHPKMLDNLVLVDYITPSNGSLTRRRCLAALEGPFDVTLYGSEDWDLWIRIAAHDCEFAYLDAVTCKYRFHSGNKSSPYSPAHLKWRTALKRNRLKVLNATFFSELSEGVQWQFLYELLLNLLEGDVESQEQVIHSDGFSNLSKARQSGLLRQVAISNILQDHNLVLGRRRLWRATVLAPGEWKSLGMFIASFIGAAGIAALERLQGQFLARGERVAPPSFPYQQSAP
jgi:glycosyltransferase involved in cell wall biosynthesis